jgi:L-ascorbate metabolism protein UlaG (beta-lactamase superfamily)
MRIAAALLAVVLLAQPAAAAEVRFLGHAALDIRAAGQRILIDPWLTGNPAAPEDAKDLSGYRDVDLILLTHGHPDHLGDVPALVEKTGARVALPADLGRTLAALELVPAARQVRFDLGGTVRPLDAEIAVTMVPAVHGSAVVVPDRDGGSAKVRSGGPAAGYVLRIGDGPTLYHAGDTAVFRDMSFITEYYEPDVAFVPAGGRETMDPAAAAHALMNYLNVRRAVPIHYRRAGRDDAPERMRQAVGDYPVEILEMAPGAVRAF